MSDTTHNTLVTVLLVLAALFVFALLTGSFNTRTVRMYGYQPASAIEIHRDYGRPYRENVSYTVIPGSSSYSYTSQQSSSNYSYSCDGMGNCWTNQ